MVSSSRAVPGFHQHAQARPWMEPGDYTLTLLFGRYSANLLDPRSHRPFSEGMDVWSVRASMMIDRAFCSPLSH